MPLHWAVANQASEAVVAALLAAYPDAAREKDRVRVAQPHILRAVACLTSHTPCPRALRVVP